MRYVFTTHTADVADHLMQMNKNLQQVEKVNASVTSLVFSHLAMDLL